jgi:hypothetical protein
MDNTLGLEAGFSLDDLSVEELEPRVEFAAPQCMFGLNGECIGAWKGGSIEFDCTA